VTDWHTPPFADLPEIGNPDYRLVAGLMDEEQYRVEGWQCMERGGMTYWRGSARGFEEYTRLRKDRLAASNARYHAREEANDEWSRQVEAMVEATP